MLVEDKWCLLWRGCILTLRIILAAKSEEGNSAVPRTRNNPFTGVVILSLSLSPSLGLGLALDLLFAVHSLVAYHNRRFNTHTLNVGEVILIDLVSNVRTLKMV